MLSHEQRCRLAEARGLLNFFDKLLQDPHAVVDANEIHANALALSAQCCALQTSIADEDTKEAAKPSANLVVVVGTPRSITRQEDAQAWAYIPERDRWTLMDSRVPCAQVASGDAFRDAPGGGCSLFGTACYNDIFGGYKAVTMGEFFDALNIEFGWLSPEKQQKWDAIATLRHFVASTCIMALGADGVIQRYQIPDLTNLEPLPKCPFRMNPDSANELLVLENGAILWLHPDQCAAFVDGVWGPVAPLPNPLRNLRFETALASREKLN